MTPGAIGRGTVPIHSADPALPDRLARPRLVGHLLDRLELVSRLAATLPTSEVRSLRTPSTLTLTALVVAALGAVKRERVHEPQVDTGALEECRETLVALDSVPRFVVEERRTLPLPVAT